MFHHRTEPDLKRSWFEGEIYNPALVSPVLDAQAVFAVFDSDDDITREGLARHIRENLEDIFNVWKLEYGTPPKTNIGLLGNPYAAKPIDECPPY